jgi:2-polyprenyl-3-methyl-5-hydroxy-6-metoxy-1,4-benzoquinol methylase
MSRITASIKKAYNLGKQEGFSELIRRSIYYKISYGYLNQLKIFVTNGSHVDAYQQWMDYKIRKSGADAIGGYDSEIGDIQFDFLKSRGLSPENTMLDIGCGALRGGKRFMNHLNSGNYTGMDINENIIETGKEKLDDEFIENNDPNIIVNNDLKFNEFASTKEFDYILAQSVFTHLPAEDIVECFENIDSIMNANSVFYATFSEGTDPTSFVNYGYDSTELVSMAEQHNLDATALPPAAYPHPGGQRMLEVTLME